VIDQKLRKIRINKAYVALARSWQHQDNLLNVSIISWVIYGNRFIFNIQTYIVSINFVTCVGFYWKTRVKFQL